MLQSVIGDFTHLTRLAFLTWANHGSNFTRLSEYALPNICWEIVVRSGKITDIPESQEASRMLLLGGQLGMS